jgi:hypothetical protein
MYREVGALTPTRTPASTPMRSVPQLGCAHWSSPRAPTWTPLAQTRSQAASQPLPYCKVHVRACVRACVCVGGGACVCVCVCVKCVLVQGMCCKLLSCAPEDAGKSGKVMKHAEVQAKRCSVDSTRNKLMLCSGTELS